jgi:hypothetical protein
MALIQVRVLWGLYLGLLWMAQAVRRRKCRIHRLIGMPPCRLSSSGRPSPIRHFVSQCRYPSCGSVRTKAAPPPLMPDSTPPPPHYNPRRPTLQPSGSLLPSGLSSCSFPAPYTPSSCFLSAATPAPHALPSASCSDTDRHVWCNRGHPRSRCELDTALSKGYVRLQPDGPPPVAKIRPACASAKQRHQNEITARAPPRTMDSPIYPSFLKPSAHLQRPPNQVFI